MASRLVGVGDLEHGGAAERAGAQVRERALGVGQGIER